ncbi:pyridoxamine 5'-phosphate oxidase family protein [Niallia circulans]|uniref:Pyridoxamine 5'-phosphate oxidase family protein n=1 Tax=Niallia circulans TaxID=1397 RepID=A0A553SMZ2_NIACI|nr:pyridoxamine 5'-phosphate oxidase family protein [Niallia circulans]TRZ38365.1 pyridoxamine 5'-phosphate oxidase family protein [Niallia circulans]
MEQIRQKKLAWTDEEQINDCLSVCRTGYLGLSDGMEPYVVPLNYVWHNKSIYFHGADEGRKIRIIESNAAGCFTICEELGTMSDPVPAKTDTAYWSIMAFGHIEKVTDKEEARNSMQALLNKYVPGYYDKPLASAHLEKYRSSLGSKTAIYKLSPSTLTAKENPLNEKARFTAGRTISLDL